MKALKIAVFGGGSSYTPELIDGFIRRKDELKVKEIWLVDVPDGLEKMEIVSALAKRMLAAAGLETQLYTTMDRAEALKGADFVMTQLRVGGLKARRNDEEIPLQHGIIGQETTGPGGFAKALRTIPVILDICKDMKTYCPEAFLINFTNPAGMVTEAVLKHTDIKVIGLCNVPITMKNNIAKMMELDPEKIHIDFMGLNHLVWGKNVYYEGVEITEEVLDKLIAGESFTMKNIPDLKWPPELLSALKMIPCPYHRYFYLREDSLKEEMESYRTIGTRATQVMAIEKALFEVYKDVNLSVKPKELENRGGAYYSDAAVSLISAIYNDKNEIHPVNIMNNGAIHNLPNDIVVEVNAVINRYGARGISVGPMPEHLYGIVSQVKAYEQLAIEAIVEKNREKAVLALINHPVVGDSEKALALVKDIYAING